MPWPSPEPRVTDLDPAVMSGAGISELVRSKSSSSRGSLQHRYLCTLNACSISARQLSTLYLDGTRRALPSHLSARVSPWRTTAARCDRQRHIRDRGAASMNATTSVRSPNHDLLIKLPYYAKVGVAYHWLVDLEGPRGDRAAAGVRSLGHRRRLRRRNRSAVRALRRRPDRCLQPPGGRPALGDPLEQLAFK
jgi:hypothetical protein